MVRHRHENSHSFQHVLNWLLQAVIGGILVIALLTLTLSVIVNASIALGVIFTLSVLQRNYRLDLEPWVTLLITVALFLHTLGMFGLYSGVWWYDHVTHTLSDS